jgi:hypothetical protein
MTLCLLIVLAKALSQYAAIRSTFYIFSLGLCVPRTFRVELRKQLLSDGQYVIHVILSAKKPKMEAAGASETVISTWNTECCHEMLLSPNDCSLSYPPSTPQITIPLVDYTRDFYTREIQCCCSLCEDAFTKTSHNSTQLSKYMHDSCEYFGIRIIYNFAHTLNLYFF